MVDDSFFSSEISKEYLDILTQIEEYCSRGPEVDLPNTKPLSSNHGKLFVISFISFILSHRLNILYQIQTDMIIMLV